MTEEQSTDVVRLKLPHEENMAKIVRLTTAAVASKTGLNLDQADDLQTGLDELFRLFLADENPPLGRLCIRFNLGPEKLEVATEGISHDLFKDNEINHYSRFILERIADRMEQIPNPRGGYEVILVKSLAE